MTEPLRLGATGAAVAEIRHKLALLGLLPVSSDPLGDLAGAQFDLEVDRAVRSFQQQRGVTGDGIVGPQTYRLLDEARWSLGARILQYSASHPLAGDDVLELQRRLLDMGFDSGRADGIFGIDTDTALRDFQRNVGLVPDGTCGPATLKALDRLRRTVIGGRPDALREDLDIARSGPRMAGKVVVIDPGHGGGDRGVMAHGHDEAAIVEDLAARIEGRLVATGVRAYLTRLPDMEMDETERADCANSLQADLLVSLHTDGSRSPRASGVATYFFGSGLGRDSVLGERFAGLVQREIVARTGLQDCRTHAKTWDLLRRTRMPAVRIEAGYLTSTEDAVRLADPSFRDRLAESIVIAIQRLYLATEDDSPTGTLRLDELVAR